MGGQVSRPGLINPDHTQPSLSRPEKDNLQSDTDWGPLSRRISQVSQGSPEKGTKFSSNKGS